MSENLCHLIPEAAHLTILCQLPDLTVLSLGCLSFSSITAALPSFPFFFFTLSSSWQILESPWASEPTQHLCPHPDLSICCSPLPPTSTGLSLQQVSRLPPHPQRPCTCVPCTCVPSLMSYNRWLEAKCTTPGDTHNSSAIAHKALKRLM